MNSPSAGATRRGLITSALGAAGAMAAHRVSALGAAPVRVGVLGDMAGPYQAFAGPGSIAAVNMAVEDFGGRVLGRPVEVLSADHQNKADLASAIARQWIAQGVAAIVNVSNSSAALAIAALVRNAKSCVALFTAAGTPRLTNEDCTPFSAHWVFDTNALSAGTAKAIIGQGGDTWFFVTMDFAFGRSLESSVAAAVRAGGGRVVGSAYHPLATTEFSSYIVRAQGSGAKVVALANSGNDTIQSVKTAHEFGLTQAGSGQQVVALNAILDDIHALGLGTAQSLLVTEAFYWDRDEASRAWSRRFAARAGGMPNMVRAGDYSATLHWLCAVRDVATTEPPAVMAAMRGRPVDDIFTRGGRLRPDGLMVHDMHLFRVKRPSESRGPWDYYAHLATIPGEQAFQALEAGRCPLVPS
jgi:branched-chain amino acid transport system substrate-binding protein